jgi:hypothetical protein
VSVSPAAPRPRPQWLRHLLIGACIAALVVILDLTGSKDWLYGIPLVLEALRLIVLVSCLGGALFILFVKDEESPRGVYKWILVAFLLAMAAAQAAALITGDRPSSILTPE